MTRAAANYLGRGYSSRRVTAAILRDSGRGRWVVSLIYDSKLDSVKRPWRCRAACRRWIKAKSKPHSFQAQARLRLTDNKPSCCPPVPVDHCQRASDSKGLNARQSGKLRWPDHARRGKQSLSARLLTHGLDWG